jgi:hypothetical protein
MSAAVIAHINAPSTQTAMNALKEELKNWNGKLMFIETMDNTLNITFNMGGWNEIWQASFEDGELWFRIHSNEDWKLKWDADRSFKNNQELLDAIHGYFVC